MSAAIKSKWSNPAEALKAIVSGLVTFAGAAVVSIEANGSSPGLVQWLIAGVFGLGALVSTYVVPNADTKVIIAAGEKVAVDVIEHRPQQIAADVMPVVEQTWKSQYVTPGLTPPTVKPAYTGPIPPVSEPVGATAVSATP